jgi:uncharacterized membrane protein YsdA (DUF1294 family)
MSLENELKNALRRVPAPEGFAGRVLARIGNTEWRPARSPWWRAVAATFLLAAILGGWGAHELTERRQEREGQRAREQVLLALRITGEKVAHAQREVRHITR